MLTNYPQDKRQASQVTWPSITNLAMFQRKKGRICTLASILSGSTYVYQPPAMLSFERKKFVKVLPRRNHRQ